MRAEFQQLFPDGIAFDTETLAGADDMRRLDQSTLVRALPAAMASLEDGSDEIHLGDNRLTPVFCGGVLRALFVLPPNPEPEQLRSWRQIVKAGCQADG